MLSLRYRQLLTKSRFSRGLASASTDESKNNGDEPRPRASSNGNNTLWAPPRPTADFFSFEPDYSQPSSTFSSFTHFDPACCLYVHRLPNTPDFSEGGLAKRLLRYTGIVPTGIRQIRKTISGQSNSVVGQTVVVYKSAKHCQVAFESLKGALREDKHGRLTQKKMVFEGQHCYVQQWDEAPRNRSFWEGDDAAESTTTTTDETNNEERSAQTLDDDSATTPDTEASFETTLGDTDPSLESKELDPVENGQKLWSEKGVEDSSLEEDSENNLKPVLDDDSSSDSSDNDALGLNQTSSSSSSDRDKGDNKTANP